MNPKLVLFATALVVASGTPCVAAPILFTGSGTNSSGNPISASASFDLSTPGELSITLANTYTAFEHIGGADVLTGLYFDWEGSAVLTPTWVGLSDGSVFLSNGKSATTPNPATGWGYFANPGLIQDESAGASAVSASGMITGANVDFLGDQHNGSGYLDGPAYGIIGNASDVFTGKAFNPLSAPSVTFTFSYTGVISTIDNVKFVYGTSPGEGGFDGNNFHVPDGGSTAILCGLALLSLHAWRRRLV